MQMDKIDYNKIETELLASDHKKEDVTIAIKNAKSRLSWGVETVVYIYSRSKMKWFEGKITEIFTNANNEEWLYIRYDDTLTKEIQRFSPHIQPSNPSIESKPKEDILKYISNSLRKIQTQLQFPEPSSISEKRKSVLELLKEEKEFLDFNFTDMSIYEKEEKAAGPNDHPCTVETCTKVNRLICGLKYYTTLDIENKANDQDKFDRFMRETYTELLNDNMHFQQYHKDDLAQINKLLLDNGIFEACDVSKCKFSEDHSGTESKNDFHKQTMDALHVYVFHSDIAQKTAEQKSNNGPSDDKDDEDDGTVDFKDEEFAKIKEAAKAKNKGKQPIKSKFTIEVIDKQKDRTTYTDGLCKHLRGKQYVNNEAVREFQKIIKKDEYDTDSILEDIKIDNNIEGNIEKALKKYNQLILEAKSFIRTIKTSSGSFSVGLRFYYWDFFKGLEAIPKEEQRAFNQNDHSGYAIKELYVEKKYKDFQEEISNYKHFEYSDYKTNVLQKVNSYINTDNVKAMKASVAQESFERLHYGVVEGSPLQPKYLIALVLYTDFSDHCTDFSASFRKTARFETLESIKERNREYYWMSRILRETVECFGWRGSGDWNGTGDKKDAWKPENRVHKLKGPFYSGMGCVMIMPEFNLRLCSPTSTSTQIQIAANFGGENGIIIQLNNDKKPGDLVRGFDCSWISRYPMEEERLFFGGFFRIKIEGIRLKASNENFFSFFQPLFYFDALITGVRDVQYLPCKNSGVKIISKLLKWKRATIKPEIGLHKYILDTFECFCASKQQMSLDLNPQSKAKQKGMLDLVMHKVEAGIEERKDDDQTNLFCEELLDYFDNLKTLEIDTFQWKGKGFSLSLIKLLELFKSAHLEKVTVKAPCLKDNNNESWLSVLWSQESFKKSVTEAYKQEKYSVKVDHIDKKWGDEDWFTAHAQL